MALRDEWDRLSSEARAWLLGNPGRVLVPHAITAAIQKDLARSIDVDGHGQMILTCDDQEFVRAEGRRSGNQI